MILKNGQPRRPCFIRAVGRPPHQGCVGLPQLHFGYCLVKDWDRSFTLLRGQRAGVRGPALAFKFLMGVSRLSRSELFNSPSSQS